MNRWGHGPIYRRFKQQQSQAKVRGIEWRLEYWEWLQIWQDSGHLEERGTGKGQWVMGRNGDAGAYETGNVKIICVETNNSEAQKIRRAHRQALRDLAGGLVWGHLSQST